MTRAGEPLRNLRAIWFLFTLLLTFAGMVIVAGALTIWGAGRLIALRWRRRGGDQPRDLHRHCARGRPNERARVLEPLGLLVEAVIVERFGALHHLDAVRETER